jgi:hypothetical protein
VRFTEGRAAKEAATKIARQIAPAECGSVTVYQQRGVPVADVCGWSEQYSGRHTIHLMTRVEQCGSAGSSHKEQTFILDERTNFLWELLP